MIHASAQLRNVERTVMAHLAGAALPWPLVPADDEKFDAARVPGFVRVSMRGMPAEHVGRLSGDKATRETIEVQAECYARGTAAEEPGTVDLASRMGETVAHRLRYANLPLVDYVTDPTGATTVANHAVRFVRPPSIVAPPPDAGWRRRIVTAEATWIARHSE